MNGMLLVWARRGGPLAPAAIEAALDAIGGRSPGNTPRWSGGGAELAVMADPAGVWPAELAVAGESGREIALAFHGRLDNRSDLTGGETNAPSAESDAEWLLGRYRALGGDFLDGLEGSFAIALFDAGRRRAVLARDGMGNRYLSHALTPDLLAAATDDSSLAALPGVSHDLDPLRLAEYYAGEEYLGTETFFAGVKAILPGEVVVVEEASERRLTLPGPSLSERLDLAAPEEVAEQFLGALRTAVERRLCGVERVAVLMSGGLDSTPIAALAARTLAGGGQAVTALSWRLSDPDGDESPWIEAVARRSALDLQWIPCDDALPYSDLANWPVHPSTPEQTAYRWFHQRAYARARERGHRLVLSGFFGDQLYQGAEGWLWSLLAAGQRGAAVDLLRQAASVRGWRHALRSTVVGPVLRRIAPPVRRPPEWLTAGAKSLLHARAPRVAETRRARRPHQARLLLTPYNGHGVNVERRYAATFGLELGSPLRDRRLVQLALAVPDHLLQCGAESRPILRAAIRGVVPEEVRTRSGKGSFLAVFTRGMDRRRLGWARRLLLDPRALWRGFVKEADVLRWLEDMPAGKREDERLCRCLDGELWRVARERGDLGQLADGEGPRRLPGD